MPKRHRKPKSPTIDKTLRIRIGKFCDDPKNKGITLRAIAEYFNVSYHQARASKMDYLSGKLTQRRPSKNNRIAQRLVKKKSIDDLFDDQVHLALAQVERDESMNVFDRVQLLDKLSATSKNVRNMKLEKHIKRTDAGLIAAIIRRYEPEASDERLIQIYREEMERWKISLV